MSKRNSPAFDRRTMLALLGTSSAVALAGCGGGGEDSPTATPTDEDSPTATSTDAVPEAYATATALNGQQRDPDSLSTKSAVNYQEEPNDGNQCSGCQFYIPDKNGDDVGACAIVEGNIAPDAWCASYVAQEETDGGGDTA